MSAPADQKLNPIEQSLGGASDVPWGVWIQPLTLLGPREVVRTGANMPRPCSTGERSGLYKAAPAPRLGRNHGVLRRARGPAVAGALDSAHHGAKQETTELDSRRNRT